MMLSLNLALPAIAVLNSGKSPGPQPPPGFTLFGEHGGRLLTDGAGHVLMERKPALTPP
jgi:hypothetical protein